MSVMKIRSTLIWGDIDQDTAKDFVITTSAFAGDNKDPIFVYIHTDGGDADAAAAIIDQMNILKRAGITVVTIAQGRCYSSGGFILAAGNRGHRYATTNSSIMLHGVSVEEISQMPLHEVKRVAEFSLKTYNALIESVFGAYNGSAKLQKAIGEQGKTLWLNPPEAIKLNIIDGIWNGQVDKYDGDEFSNSGQSGDS